jgi:RNA polymerase sigma factor (sigma-70 family)
MPLSLQMAIPRDAAALDFSAFYAENAEAVLIYLARRCLDPEVAVDLMAETFAEAFANRHARRGRSDEEARAWVFGIARNLLANYFRRGRIERKALLRLGFQTPAVSPDDLARIEELADLAAVRSAVAQQFASLSTQQRDALQLRVIDELPYAEVARRLAVSEDAARARVSRGLRQLVTSLRVPTAEGAEIHE